MALIQQCVPGQDPVSTRREGVQCWEALVRNYPDRERPLRGLAAALFYKPDLERSLGLYEEVAKRYPQGKNND
jgi:hypothetical protein